MSYEESIFFGFTAGEISPKFDARPDLSKYDLGMSKLENFFVDYTGSILSRQGMEMVAPLPASGEFKMFQFTLQDEDITIVFTDQLIRFIKDADYVLETAVALTAASSTGTTVSVTATTAFSAGDLIQVNGTGEALIDGRYFYVTANSGTVLTLTCAFGLNVPAFSGVTAGTVARAYTLTSPYTAGTLNTLSAEQRLDDLYITGVSYARRKLTRIADDNWTLALVAAPTKLPAPTGLSGSTTAAGSAGTVWAVTAVDADGNEGDISARLFYTGHVNYTATAGVVKLSWTAVTGAVEYYVYRSYVFPDSAYADVNQQLGYVGKTTGTSFSDQNITADFTKTPPIAYDPFASGNYPNLFKVFQQRGVYLGSTANPVTLWASKPGQIDNFDYSVPLTAADSYKFELDAKVKKPIKHAVALRNGFLVFTDEGVTQLRAESGKAISGLNALAEPQVYQGISDTPPITINLDVIFAERFATRLYAMLYTEYTESFQLQDLSILATHLTGENKRITRMHYIETPNKLIYCLREDGTLLVLTYLREHEVFAWAQLNTLGRVLDISVHNINNRQHLMLVVERMINGTRQIVIERMAPRNDNSYREYWGLDSSVRRELAKPDALLYPSGTMEACTLNATAAVFGSYAVGDYILFSGGYGKITAINSADEVEVTWEVEPTKLLPQSNVPLPDYMKAGQWEIGSKVSELNGLWHLEGQTLGVLTDGDYYELEVIGGKVTIPYAAMDIIAGLSYRCRAQTLPVQSKQLVGSGRVRRIFSVLPRFYNTRGVSVGTDFSSDMQEVASRTDEAWGEQLGFADDVLPIPVGELYNTVTQICMEQVYPLPACITGIAATIDIGEDVVRGD